jgi:hypothetical protein
MTSNFHFDDFFVFIFIETLFITVNDCSGRRRENVLLRLLVAQIFWTNDSSSNIFPAGKAGQVRPRRSRSDRGGSPPAPRKRPPETEIYGVV